MNKVTATMIPYLKIPLNKGDFIFAMSAFIPILKILNVNKVVVRVAQGCKGCTILREKW